MAIIEGKAWEPKEIISTGSLLLDSCLKFGGIPIGSIMHYYSPPENEGSFKTTLGMCGLAEFQKKGWKVGAIDTELTPWDQQWLEGKGLKINKKLWVYARSTSGEQAITDMIEMIEKKKCRAIMFDSIDYARPESYHDSNPGDSNTGVHAKLMRQFWQRAKDYAEQGVTFFVINQAAAKVGHMPWDKGENPTGGRGSTYAPTVNVRMRRPSDSNLMDADHIPIKFQIKRSKLGGSWRAFTTYFVQGQGIDRHSELVLLGWQVGLFKPKNKQYFENNWSNWEDEKLGDLVDARNWVFDNEKVVVEKLKELSFPDQDMKLENLVGL
jgi:RecA/RadA recombinase